MVNRSLDAISTIFAINTTGTMQTLKLVYSRRIQNAEICMNGNPPSLLKFVIVICVHVCA